MCDGSRQLNHLLVSFMLLKCLNDGYDMFLTKTFEQVFIDPKHHTYTEVSHVHFMRRKQGKREGWFRMKEKSKQVDVRDDCEICELTHVSSSNKGVAK